MFNNSVGVLLRSFFCLLIFSAQLIVAQGLYDPWGENFDADEVEVDKTICIAEDECEDEKRIWDENSDRVDIKHKNIAFIVDNFSLDHIVYRWGVMTYFPSLGKVSFKNFIKQYSDSSKSKLIIRDAIKKALIRVKEGTYKDQKLKVLFTDEEGYSGWFNLVFSLIKNTSDSSFGSAWVKNSLEYKCNVSANAYSVLLDSIVYEEDDKLIKIYNESQPLKSADKKVSSLPYNHPANLIYEEQAPYLKKVVKNFFDEVFLESIAGSNNSKICIDYNEAYPSDDKKNIAENSVPSVGEDNLKNSVIKKKPNPVIKSKKPTTKSFTNKIYGFFSDAFSYGSSLLASD